MLKLEIGRNINKLLIVSSELIEVIEVIEDVCVSSGGPLIVWMVYTLTAAP